MTDELVKRLLDIASPLADEAAGVIHRLTAERDARIDPVHVQQMLEAAQPAMAEVIAALEADLDRLREAGSFAAKSLRIIAGMDLMAASAVAYNAARELELTLKGETP